MRAYIKDKHIISYFNGEPTDSKEYDYVIDIGSTEIPYGKGWWNGEAYVEKTTFEPPLPEVLNLSVGEEYTFNNLPLDTKVAINGTSYHNEVLLHNETTLSIVFPSPGFYKIHFKFLAHHLQTVRIIVS